MSGGRWGRSAVLTSPADRGLTLPAAGPSVMLAL